MVDLSIIIISYNTKSITKNCLDSIVESFKKNTDINVEIVVLDNGSSDGSAEMLKKYSKSVLQKNMIIKTIISNNNLGFAKGNNRAVSKASGKYILFLNSDIEAIDNAVPKLYKYYMSKDNTFDFVGGKLLEKDLSPQASCGPTYSLPVIAGALFLRGDYWGLTRYSPNKQKEVDWVSGACIITKKDIYDKMGGFDEKIFMYMDEIDLFLRAKRAGYRVGFYPYAKFIHLGSASSRARTQPILQVFRGFLYLYSKHYSGIHLKTLKLLLQLKAYIALFIGKTLKNKYLIDTYENALQIVKEY